MHTREEGHLSGLSGARSDEPDVIHGHNDHDETTKNIQFLQSVTGAPCLALGLASV